jgi:thiamine-phosphate pyrophosphorylase
MAGCVIEGLYGLTPDGLPREVLLERVAAALAGGMRLLQYRAKQEERATRLATAAHLLDLCRRHGACLIVNDDPDLAVRVGADGVHLGRDDAPVREARRLMGSGAVIGVSCYADLERAVRLRAEGADYVAFGSFFASSVKPGAVRAPVELLTAARARLDCPTVAIGGVTLDNAGMLLDAGASALAVITDLFAHPDVRGRAEAYTRLLARPG